MTTREENARVYARWTKTKDDAIALKAARPELVVNVPGLVLGCEAAAFFEQFAHMAVRGDAFTAPHIARGAVFYTTIDGRVHRVIVEDLEPELRGEEFACAQSVSAEPERCKCFERGSMNCTCGLAR